MAERILKIRFKGKCVDLPIDDVDQCLLIDVLNDFLEAYHNKGFELPKYPILSYCINKTSHELVDDKTLMKMFEVKEDKEIDVCVGCLNEPNSILKLAQEVKSMQQPVVPTKPSTNEPLYEAPRDKLPLKRGSAHPTSPVSPDLRRSPRFSPSHSTQPMAQAEIIPTSPNVRRTPRLSPSHTQPIAQAEKIPTPPHNNDTYHPNTTQSQSPTVKKKTVSTRCPSGRKIPKTTAKLKGIWVPMEKNKVDKGAGSSKNRGPRPRRRAERELEIDEGSELSDSESDFVPESDEEHSGSEEGYDNCIDEEVNDLHNLNYVDDGWEPFSTVEWDGEDEGYFSRLYKNGEVYDDYDFGRIRMRKWMLFVNKEHFKDALRDFCIQEGFAVVVRKSDNFRYTAECADEKCDWRIHASKLPDGFTWAIKSIRQPGHICQLNLTHNPMCTCEWAAQKLLEDIRANPDIKAKSLNALLQERYGLEMCTSTVYRMKKIAITMTQGGHDESYSLLPAYCELLKEKNPNSIAFCTWAAVESPQPTLQFKSIFISFEAQFKGLINGCRGLIGVDGTHLKGSYGGVLLAAVCLDGNNEIFPVAVAVVDSENKTSWTWFFHHLKQIVTSTGREDWNIISDRQKGVDPSLDKVWPGVPRRYCARHLCKNFKTDYPGLFMHKLFWAVTNATSVFNFKKALQKVKEVAGIGAVKWFKDIGPLDRWTKWRFDPTVRSDENTNNFVESFNSTIGSERCMPVLTLLEGVRRIAMVRHATRQQIAEEWQDNGICPNITERLRVLTRESRGCTAFSSGRGEFEVHVGRSVLPVSLTNRECACGKWQISGIPCRHAVRAILHDGKQPSMFVSDWYSVARYKQTYSGNISAIPDPERWPDINAPKLIPPTIKRSIGRPSRSRRREQGEQRKGKRQATVQCQKCKSFGHNSKTCKGGLTAKEMGKKAPAAAAQPTLKKRTRQQYNEQDATNMIEQLVTQSQPTPAQASHLSQYSQPCASQPGPSLSQPRPSVTQPSPSVSLSPKAKKIMQRLSMLK